MSAAKAATEAAAASSLTDTSRAAQQRPHQHCAGWAVSAGTRPPRPAWQAAWRAGGPRQSSRHGAAGRRPPGPHTPHAPCCTCCTPAVHTPQTPVVVTPPTSNTNPHMHVQWYCVGHYNAKPQRPRASSSTSPSSHLCAMRSGITSRTSHGRMTGSTAY